MIFRINPAPFLILLPSPSLTERLKGVLYSYRNASTGFLVAARQLCQLTVNSAIPRAKTPERTKIHQLRFVL